VAVSLLAAMGFGSGFINVVMVPWLQTRTDPAMMGRVMSLVMLASFAMAPLSFAIAGALVDISTVLTFVVPGCLVLAATVFAAGSRTVRAND